MKFIKYCIIALCIFLFRSVSSQNEYKAEVLLNKSMLQDAKLDSISFIPSMAFTGKGFLALASANDSYLLGEGGLIKIFYSQDSIHSFTITPDNHYLAICKQGLCQLNSQGKLSKLLELPNKNMQVVSGNNAFYVFGKEKSSSDYAIYMILRNNTYAKVISVKTPIHAVLEYENTILFASENKIIGINAETKKLFELVSLADVKETITSIALDPEGNSLYLSSNKAVYQVQDNKAQCISNEFSGLLLFNSSELLVFNVKNSFIVKLNKSYLHPVSDTK